MVRPYADIVRLQIYHDRYDGSIQTMVGFLTTLKWGLTDINQIPFLMQELERL
jgi:folate-dependent tRNA-U54 methylase TrmFO/GidA